MLHRRASRCGPFDIADLDVTFQDHPTTKAMVSNETSHMYSYPSLRVSQTRSQAKEEETATSESGPVKSERQKI